MEGRRNEVLDCANYARGLAAMRGWDRWKEAHFGALETVLRQASAAPAAVPADLVHAVAPVRLAWWHGPGSAAVDAF